MAARIASTEFRKVYAQLDEPHEVTALGRIIGTWLPARYVPSASSASPDPRARDGLDTLRGHDPSEAAARTGDAPMAAAPTGDSRPDPKAVTAAYQRLAKSRKE